MKTAARSHLTFGDLVVAVSTSSRNSREATLAIADLLQSRRVVINPIQTSRRLH